VSDFARDGHIRRGVAKAEIHVDLVPHREGPGRFEKQALKTDVAHLAHARLLAIGVRDARFVRHSYGLTPFLAGEMMGWL